MAKQHVNIKLSDFENEFITIQQAISNSQPFPIKAPVTWTSLKDKREYNIK